MRAHAFLSILTLAFSLHSGCGGPPESAREAQHLLARGDYGAADNAANRTLVAHPKDPTAWRVKIRVAMARGTLDTAIELYREWKTLRGKDDPKAYRMMAMANLWQGLQVPSAQIQTQAIQIVERHQVEKLANEVRDLLSADSDLVAAAAAAALLSSHPAAPKLAVQLLQSDNPRARAIVVRSIGKKAGRVARSDIFPALKDSDAKVRLAAVNAIALWKSSKDKELLLNVADKDRNGPVRARALRALVSIGGQEAVKMAFIKLFARNTDKVSRVETTLPVASTIPSSPGRLKSRTPTSVSPLRTSKLVMFVTTDKYVGAQLASIAILDAHGGNKFNRELKTITGSESLTLALRAALALHKRGVFDAKALLTRAFASTDKGERSAALNSAARLLDKVDALALGKRGILDPEVQVRLTAARLLLHLGAKAEAIAVMREALQSGSRAMKLQAATALAKRGDTEALLVLSLFAKQGGAEEKQEAIFAHRSASVVTSGLIDALADDSIAVRLAATDVIIGG